jgi:hypothetical protein
MHVPLVDERPEPPSPIRGSERRIRENASVCQSWGLAESRRRSDRTVRVDDAAVPCLARAGPTLLLRSVEVAIVGEPEGAAGESCAGRERLAEAFRSRSRQRTSTLCFDAMTYSIFDSTGNLVDAFGDSAAALDYLACIAQAEPGSASEVFLVAQDDDGNTLGHTVYAANVPMPA